MTFIHENKSLKLGIGIETILPNKIDRIALAFSFTIKRNFNNIRVFYFLFVTFSLSSLLQFEVSFKHWLEKVVEYC